MLTALLAAALLSAAPEFHLYGGGLVLPGPIAFDSGSDKLLPESEGPLQHVKAYLEAKNYVSLVRIEGHAENQALSEKRAMAVARWLVAAGIKCDRLIPVGFGSSKPVVPTDTPEGRAQNVRVAFVNAALRSRAIGGMPVDGGGKVAGDPCR